MGSLVASVQPQQMLELSGTFVRLSDDEFAIIVEHTEFDQFEQSSLRPLRGQARSVVQKPHALKFGEPVKSPAARQAPGTHDVAQRPEP